VRHLGQASRIWNRQIVRISNAEGLESPFKLATLEDKRLPMLVKKPFVFVLALKLTFSTKYKCLPYGLSFFVQRR